MSNVVLNRAIDVFPVGTTVAAYPASGWPQYALPPSGAPPAGVSSVGSAAVQTDGSVSIPGASDGVKYFVGADLGGGNWRWMRGNTLLADLETFGALADVDSSAKTDQDVVYYDSASGKFKGKAQSALSVDTSGLTTSATDRQVSSVRSGRVEFNDPAVFNVLDYATSAANRAAIYAGSSTALTATQAATDAAHAAGGGVVLFPRGGVYDFTSHVHVSPNRAGTKWLVFSGYGATIKITKGFLGLWRAADYDTFSRIVVEGFVVDGQNSASSGPGIIGNGGPDIGYQRVNINHVIVRDCQGINRTVDAALANAWVSFASGHLANDEATQTTIKNVLCRNLDLTGGSHGVSVQGALAFGGTGTSLNVFYDNIVMEDVRHDYGVYSSTITGSSIQVGSLGYGNYCALIRCKSTYANDSAFEINACQHTIFRDCTLIDPRRTGYYIRNFHALADPLGHQCEIHGCRVEFRNTTPTSGLDRGHGIHLGAGGANDRFGQVSIRDYTYYNTTGMTMDGGDGSSNNMTGHAIAIMEGSSVRRLLIDTVTMNETALAIDTTTRGNVTAPIALLFDSLSSDKTQLVIRNVRYRAAGTIVAAPNALNVAAISIGAAGVSGTPDVTFDIDNVAVDFSGIASNGNFSWAVFNFGRGSAGINLRGRIANCSVLNTSNTSGGRNGLRIGVTQAVTIDGALFVEGCDFRNISSTNNEFGLGVVATYAPNIIARDCLFSSGSFPTAESAAITPGVSPYAYRNLDMVREHVLISGGTVSDVAVSKAGSTYLTLFADTAQPRVVSLEPGWFLRVTYTVAPTMTKVAQR